MSKVKLIVEIPSKMHVEIEKICERESLTMGKYFENLHTANTTYGFIIPQDKPGTILSINNSLSTDTQDKPKKKTAHTPNKN